MLNMQAVSTAMRAGRSQGYRFSAGMAVVFPFQAGVGVFFANYLTKHPAVIESVKQWAVPLLLVGAAVFIYKGVSVRKARRQDRELPYNGGPFRRGLGISCLNLLNIPFFFAITGWLLAHDVLPNESRAKLLYLFGVGVGAFLIFLLYARLADWFNRRAGSLTRNINFLIGGLLVFLAVVQVINLM